MMRRRYLLFTEDPANRPQEGLHNVPSEVEALRECQSSLK